MQQILDIIIEFFEKENIKVESGKLEEDQRLLHKLQTNNPVTKPGI